MIAYFQVKIVKFKDEGQVRRQQKEAKRKKTGEVRYG
jgi:hypothetical protein